MYNKLLKITRKKIGRKNIKNSAQKKLTTCFFDELLGKGISHI